MALRVLFTFKIKEFQKVELTEQFPSVKFFFDGSAEDKHVEVADVVVTYGSDIDTALLDRATSLKWLMVASAGVDKVPLTEIAKRDIIVTNVSGIHKTPMAESVLAHMLALVRSVSDIYKLNETKEWARKFKSTELKGSTAIILGPGAIGSEIGRLLQAFDVHTVGCNRSGRKAESMDEIILFEELIDKLPEADFVISVLPSTPQTQGLITAEHFNAMKDTAVFMNFGRGDIMDEAVLIHALEEGIIGHAVLDVFEVEPLPENHKFWTLENCTVSPHVSALSGKYVERALEIFHRNLNKWLNEETELENIVNPEIGY